MAPCLHKGLQVCGLRYEFCSFDTLVTDCARPPCPLRTSSEFEQASGGLFYSTGDEDEAHTHSGSCGIRYLLNIEAAVLCLHFPMC